MTANPNMKIIIGWKPDTIENIEEAVAKLQTYGKTVSIIHWEPEGDTISLKEQFTGAYHNDSLKAVYKAELLLE